MDELNILKSCSDFSYSEINFRTEYNRSKSAINIINKYKLVSMVANRSFIDTMTTIGQFIYRIVPANGKIIKNPYAHNGEELLDLCSRGFSLNCAGYSILFNEIVLALGYNSKCIFCRAYNLYDDDSHVLCQVYNEILKSWVVIDPAQGCVPCNDKKEGLDIIKLRNYIINGEEFLLMKSRRAFYDDKIVKRYRSYLQKYLFMFLVLDKYGGNYDITNPYLILPLNCDYSEYDIPFKCRITHNLFYVFN